MFYFNYLDYYAITKTECRKGNCKNKKQKKNNR